MPGYAIISPTTYSWGCICLDVTSTLTSAGRLWSKDVKQGHKTNADEVPSAGKVRSMIAEVKAGAANLFGSEAEFAPAGSFLVA